MPPSEEDALPASITWPRGAEHSPQIAFIFPCPHRCDTALNLEAKVLGEFPLKVGPNRTARGSFLKPWEAQDTVPKGQEPHPYPPPDIFFFKHCHISDLCFITARETPPKFRGTGLGISKVDVLNGFLQATGHCPAPGREERVPLHL